MNKDIDIKRISISGVNSYIISGDEGAVLIDTGFYRNRKKLYEQVKDKDIKIIFLTHGHADHIGGAAFLSQELNVPVAMGKGDLELLNDNFIREVYSSSLLGNIVRSASIQNFKKAYYERMKIDIFLTEDMVFEYGKMKIKVIELPGHTKGSVGFIINNNFFVGDAMMNMVFPTAALIYEDKEASLNSVRKIKNADIVYVFSGHGKKFAIRKFRK